MRNSSSASAGDTRAPAPPRGRRESPRARALIARGPARRALHSATCRLTALRSATGTGDCDRSRSADDSRSSRLGHAQSYAFVSATGETRKCGPPPDLYIAPWTPIPSYCPTPCPANPDHPRRCSGRHGQGSAANPNAMVLRHHGSGRTPFRARRAMARTSRPSRATWSSTRTTARTRGRELAQNPRAAAVIHWDHLHRQIRVEGIVAQSPAADSDAYFASASLAEPCGRLGQ